MKWQGRRQSSNVNTGGSGRRMRPIGGGGLLILMLIVFLMGGNPLDVLNNGSAPTQNITTQQSQEIKTRTEFLSVVLADTEDVWGEIFKQHNLTYSEPKLTLYSGSTQSACGTASSQTGPFYCPGDETIYMDTAFYDDLHNKFAATGDFALAYVLAHEVGHHVQHQLGVLDQVFALKNKLSEVEFNQYMIRLELQADYYAGVYAHYAKEMGYLEAGDIEEAMNAAAGVGDDRIQEQAYGKSMPDTFTHGTSEQRMRWFKKGYEAGTIEDGDTFRARNL